MTRLLVIRFSALGDVAMLVPVVQALAYQYPQIEITVLSQSRMEDLFSDMPSNVIFKGVNLKTQTLRDIVSSLGRFDCVADMHGVWRSLYIRTRLKMTGARVSAIRKGRWSKFVLTHGGKKKPIKRTVLRYVDVLHRLGLTVQCQEKTFKKDGEGIGIAPFAAHRGKIYPPEKMEEVVRILSERKEKIVLFGNGEKEQKMLENWERKYPHVQSLAGKYTLKQELDIMRRLRVMLSMDSANMHLASLAGTRVVSVWGATHPDAGFLGFGQLKTDCVQRELPCRPCSIYGNKPCKYGDYRCMEIAPETIIERIG